MSGTGQVRAAGRAGGRASFMTTPGGDAVIRYVVPGEKAFFYPADRARSYWPAVEHRMRVESMRPHASELALERNGFVLLNEPTKVRDFYDADEVKRVYYPEVFDLVK